MGSVPTAAQDPSFTSTTAIWTGSGLWLAEGGGRLILVGHTWKNTKFTFF